MLTNSYKNQHHHQTKGGLAMTPQDEPAERPGSELAGERLQAARKRLGMSRPKLATLIDKHPTTVQNIERGSQHVGGTYVEYHSSAETLARFALAVGEDPEEIVELAGLHIEDIPAELLEVDDDDDEGDTLIVVVPLGRDAPPRSVVMAHIKKALGELQ